MLALSGADDVRSVRSVYGKCRGGGMSFGAADSHSVLSLRVALFRGSVFSFIR